MNKLFALFLDRLAERIVTLAAGLVSSRVEGLQAAAQADQQSQLEELARQYDAEGKPEIAATVRQRAARLTSADLSAEAVETMRRVAEEPLSLAEPGQDRPNSELRRLPDFGNSPASKSKPQRKKSSKPGPEDNKGAAK